MSKLKKGFLHFLKHVRFGYLLFSSLLLIGLFFGAFELIKITLLENSSEKGLRVLFFTRGVITSLALMVWAAWTVYNYRELYQEKLDTREEQYRNIIESSADAIITINNDNIIKFWNNGAELIFGWSRDDIVGESVEKIIPDSLIEKNELERLEAGMKYQGHVTNYQTERISKEGKRILVNLTQSFIRNENDEIIGRAQILRDLTELKIREEQIQHSERLATVGHMAAGVAHEVGNPLTAISSLVQIAQRKAVDPFVEEQLKKVREHIQRIAKIVRDLVDFSRPASLEKEKMQLNEIINSAVGLLEHDARCKDVQFNLDLSSSLPELRGVPDHFHQVIVNLLLNAVDAMEDSEEPIITIKTWHEEDYTCVSVKDTGKGIPEEEKNRIFEPFFTTKQVGSGTGLGLSVSHGIITRMGGSIEFESTLNEGTTFIIKLPTQQSPADV